MRVLLDTNVILDVLGNRAPFAAASQAVWDRITTGQVQASVAAITPTTVFYVLAKQVGKAQARRMLGDLLTTFSVCPVDGVVLKLASARPMLDFEDAVVDAAAELAGIPTIVTRNGSDFAGSTRRIVDPDSFVQALDQQQATPNPP
jgi:predicted nucleic acid-binding protein